MLEREPHVQFLEVEPIAKRVLAEMGNVIDERYARRAFDEIARGVEDAAQTARIVIIAAARKNGPIPRGTPSS